MRNPILTIAIAFAMAVPCAAASAQSMQGYIKTEGTKQGKYKGSGTGTTKSSQSQIPKGSTGPTAPPKPTQGTTHK